jgi:hypothetical protein
MSYAPEEYTPTPDEIDEVLSVYNDWLDRAYEDHGNKDIAIDLATARAQADTSTGKVFSWVASNDAALIYDVDGTISDDDDTKDATIKE